MGRDTRPDAAPADAVRQEATFLRRLLRRYGRTLLIAFLCIAAPLWIFGELAEEVLEDGPLPFDEPLLHLIHGAGGPLADQVALFLAAVGFAWGVVPIDIALVVGLALRRRFREGAFAMLALGGSGLLNVLAKHAIARDRPALWAPLTHETTYSFPSGHAMGAATLAAVLVVLAWRTPYRGWVLAIGITFAVAVGLSRVYLGVHFPSDILAGWCAATAWTLVCHVVVQRMPRLRGRRMGR